MARAFPWIALALLAAFPLLAPLVGLDYYVNFVRRVLVFALAAASLNFILGFGGLVALGHMGFVGVGAYTLVALADAGQVSAWLLWPAAALAAGIVAALVGLVALRTRGVYFIMITLAFAQMLYFAAVSLRAYGGDDGY
ncbi:MAG: branched-chain amino acid ABC transporter permease, partial [Pseudacidovorax sp.]|nr:branched-chain amino acid ABC transporter permease [Pseudacidovorax sp.]